MTMDLTPSAWHLWLIAGLVAGALEIKLSGFVMLWFALGAFAAALTAGVGLSINFQLLIFSAVSVALFASSRTLFKRAFMRGTSNVKTGAEAMMGGEAIVTEVLPHGGTGTVRINGELWTAAALDGPVAVGERVTVESIVGLKLKVRRALGAPFVIEKARS